MAAIGGLFTFFGGCILIWILSVCLKNTPMPGYTPPKTDIATLRKRFDFGLYIFKALRGR